MGQPELLLDRYGVHAEIASGGMATVYLGWIVDGPEGAWPLAIKRLHPQLAKDPMFCAMLREEARLATRIHHPNVVTTLDVAMSGKELFVVMEYLHGAPLSQLLRVAGQAGRPVPPRIVVAIVGDVLRGLHAAHEVTDEHGAPLGLVHRDVSPHNILVGADGRTRVIDFGVAKAAGRLQATDGGKITGKFAYMAPEQLRGEPLDRTADIYAAGVVLWETLTGKRLFTGSAETPNFLRLLKPEVRPPSSEVPGLPAALDQLTLKALAPDRTARCQTAKLMASALTIAVEPAPAEEVAAWVQSLVGEQMDERARQIATMQKAVLAAHASGQQGHVGTLGRSADFDYSKDGQQHLMLPFASTANAEAAPLPQPDAREVPGGDGASQRRPLAVRNDRVRRRSLTPAAIILIGSLGAGAGGLLVWMMLSRGGGPATPPQQPASVEVRPAASAKRIQVEVRPATSAKRIQGDAGG